MKLSEIFTQLTTGELSQIAIGGTTEGELNEANYPKIIPHVNLALTALHKRFNLKEGRLTLALQPGQTVYHLNSEFAESNRRSRQLVKYIRDTDSEFKDDILKVERILTDADVDLHLNNEADMYSCFTPSSTMLRVPSALVSGAIDVPAELKTQYLTVVYRANHAPIVIGSAGLVPSRVDVELPYSHLEPLLYYIASRVNNPMGMSNEFHAGNSYYAKYEAACAELERVNLNVDNFSQNEKLYRNGWM